MYAWSCPYVSVLLAAWSCRTVEGKQGATVIARAGLHQQARPCVCFNCNTLSAHILKLRLSWILCRCCSLLTVVGDVCAAVWNGTLSHMVDFWLLIDTATCIRDHTMLLSPITTVLGYVRQTWSLAGTPWPSAANMLTQGSNTINRNQKLCCPAIAMMMIVGHNLWHA